MISRGSRNALITCHPRDRNDSLVEMERPRKRVRISFEKPSVFLYDGDKYPVDKTITESISGDFGDENEQPKSRRTKVNPWLSRHDLAYFRASAKRLCLSINLDGVIQEAYDSALYENDPKHYSTSSLIESNDYSRQRGLEKWSSSQHSILRSIKIIEVKTAVLLEQSIQFLSGRSDPVRLAELSQKASSTSQRFAQVLASADAAMAMQAQLGSSVDR